MASGCGEGSPAPALEGPDSKGDWYSIAMVADVGEPVSIGNFIRLRPSVQGSLAIQSVELVGASGVAVVGVVLNGTRRHFGMIGTKAGFPVPELDQDRLAVPVTVAADDAAAHQQGLAVTFGLRRDQPGRGEATGFKVSYTLNGKERQETFRTGLALCAVPGYARRHDAPPTPCEAVPEPR
jgi:hypothetical protein